MSSPNDSFRRRIDLDGYALQLETQGNAAPSVVFEAGLWDIGLAWALVLPDVAQFAKAISYDRAGYGASDASPKPRDGTSMIQELRELLQRAEIPAPYVLVGQSYGGMLTQLFAYTFPQEVAGLVLVDSAHPDQESRFPEAIRNLAQPMMQAQLDGLRQLSHTVAAQGPAAAPTMPPVPPQFSPQLAEKYQANTISTVTRLETMIGELENLEMTRSQLRAARSDALQDMPIIVLAHGVPAAMPNLPADINRAYEETWQQLQHELAASSARGKYIVAENAGHMIHHDRPDLVAQAIREVVNMVRV